MKTKKKAKNRVPESEMSQVMIIKKRHQFPPHMVRYIKNVAVDLQKRMGLTEYEVKVEFIETDLAMKGSAISTASVIIDCVYLTATIYVRPTLREDWEEKNYGAVCNAVVHELSHIYFEPIYGAFVDTVPGGLNNEMLTDTVERQVQRVAKVIQKLLPKNYHVPSRWLE